MEDDAVEAIVAMVNRETEAWNRKDADALVSLFHADMVWPWPSSPLSHDPAQWTTGMGRFDAGRWRSAWQALFDSHDLVSNHREIVRVEITPQRDAGFAVVALTPSGVAGQTASKIDGMGVPARSTHDWPTAGR